MNFKEYITIQEASFPWRQTLSKVPGLSLFKEPEPEDPIDIKDIAPQYKGSLKLMLQQGNVDAYAKALIDILSRKPGGEEWVQRYQGMPKEEKAELMNKIASLSARKKSSYGIEAPPKRKRSPKAEKFIYAMRPGSERDKKVNDLINSTIATLPASERHQRAIKKDMAYASTAGDKRVLRNRRLEAIKTLRDGTKGKEWQFWTNWYQDVEQGRKM